MKKQFYGGVEAKRYVRITFISVEFSLGRGDPWGGALEIRLTGGILGRLPLKAPKCRRTQPGHQYLHLMLMVPRFEEPIGGFPILSRVTPTEIHFINGTNRGKRGEQVP